MRNASNSKMTALGNGTRLARTTATAATPHRGTHLLADQAGLLARRHPKSAPSQAWAQWHIAASSGSTAAGAAPESGMETSIAVPDFPFQPTQRMWVGHLIEWVAG